MTDNAEKIYAIQSYLRENARGQYENVPVPPFTLFFHPSDPFPYFSYAIPDFPCGGDLGPALNTLVGEFRRRGRIPRFEFLERFAPDLPAALQAAGFTATARQWSMLCTPGTLHSAPEVAGLDLVTLHPESPSEDIFDFLLTQRQGFDPANEIPPAEEEIRQARVDFLVGGWRAYLARLAGEPAGVGIFGRIIGGVTEVAGIATRVKFRRRGIASYLTAHLTGEAFRAGAITACLTAEDERAGRIYARVGYGLFTTMLAYTLENS
jgi:GNAT superfamily N-acetyltransferase